MKKKYQVFISSTYTDLKEERMAVTQCLLDNDCIPVGMEQFPASGMSQMDYIKKMLDDCDYYILILAGRYGTVDKDGIGFTEKEFDYACEKNIPIMSFVVENPMLIPIGQSEQTDIGKEKLASFREKVCNGRMVKFHTNIDQLKANVATSINKCIRDFPAIGWVRGYEPQNREVNIENKIANYLETHTISEEGIKDLFTDTTEGFPKITSIQYRNPEKSSHFTFDYSNNNGEFTIGCGKNTFVTKWSKASNTSIHAYKDGTGIIAIARIKAPAELQDALNYPCDFSSRCRTPQIGDIIIWKNVQGNYAGTKIISIKDDTRGADHDELTCEYIICN